MRQFILFISLCITLSAHAQTVRVAAAGNLRFILDDIKAKYAEKNPKVKIDVNLGASGALYQQIINGAAFDFFMAADKTFPDKLKAQGYASGDAKIYAYGKLVLWSNTVDVTKGIDMITGPSVTRIAIAKPGVAPYGERAVQAMKYFNLYDKVKGKLVFGDNIAQTAQYVQTGNAQVGFIALALVMGPEMQGQGKYIELDPKSYKPVEQACVLLKGWERNPEAGKFMKFVLSADCRPIFEKYGFIVP
jgi:molybdate transport system substrate-binding protein